MLSSPKPDTQELSVRADQKADAKSDASKFIYVLEGKIGRLEKDRTPSNILGLCTDNFTSCNIIVLISNDKKRYVLIHVDQSLTEQQIKEQLNWVGQSSYNFLLRRNVPHWRDPVGVRDEVMPTIKRLFKEVIVPEHQEAISIKWGDVEPNISAQLPANVEYHPQVVFLTVQHQVDGQFIPPPSEGTRYALNPLLYDIGKWAIYVNFNLSPYASRVIHHHGLNGKDACQILFTLRDDLGCADHDKGVYNSATLCAYFYLCTHKNVNPATFLNDQFEAFKSTCSRIPNFWDRKVETYVSLCKAAKDQPALNKLVATIAGDKNFDEKKRTMLLFQATVVLNAYNLMFVKFASPTLLTVDAKAEIREGKAMPTNSSDNTLISSATVQLIFANVKTENGKGVASLKDKPSEAVAHFSQTKKLLEEIDAKKLHENDFKEHQTVLATVCSNLGSAYLAVGNKKEAKTVFELALTIRTSLFGKEHDLTKKIAHKLKECEAQVASTGAPAPAHTM